MYENVNFSSFECTYCLIFYCFHLLWTKVHMLAFCLALFVNMPFGIYAKFLITFRPRSEWVLVLVKDNKQSRIKEQMLGDFWTKSYFQDMFLSSKSCITANRISQSSLWNPFVSLTETSPIGLHHGFAIASEKEKPKVIYIPM